MEGERKSQKDSSVEEENDGNASVFFVNKSNSSAENPPRHRNEKIIISVLIVVGILAIFFGAKSFSDNIFYPTWLRMDNASVSDSQDLAEVQALKNKDTDGDGLSDYDETYVYRSSPYLADSNSNGINDKQEVLAGKDPSCIGDNCGLLPVDVSSTSINSVPKLGQDDSQNISFTPAQLREMLISSGIAKEEVDMLNDQQIIVLYQKAVSQPDGVAPSASDIDQTIQELQSLSTTTNIAVPNSNISNSSTSVVAAPNTSALNDLKNISMADFRQLLLTNGMPKATLDQISDEQLKQMLDQQLSNASSTKK